MNKQICVGLALALTTLGAVAQWKYRTTEDKMRGETSKFAEVISLNKIQLDFPYRGGSALEMTVRSSPKYGEDVIFQIGRGQIPCHSDCSVSVKFDSEEVTEWAATGPASGRSDSLFIDEHEQFLEKLKAASRVIVEVSIYDYGAGQFTFNVKGLKWK